MRTIMSAQKGFTLMELMIAVGIVAVISAIAVPVYTGYIETSRESVLANNISTIEVFQEDFRLRTGSYLLVAADLAAITAGIGWEPQGDDGISYKIADGGDGTYDVTGTDETGKSICVTYPGGDRC
jgi:prepilin-type N-terminal cleavage/methylation domain-containing protein